jgi:hypothetical protein
MYMTEHTEKRWQKVLDHDKSPKIKDPFRRAVTALVLENTLRAIAEENNQSHVLAEAAPANQSGAFPNATNLKGYDPILISLIRRSLPNLIAFDICGVQPMTGPTGLIFAMRTLYTSQDGTEVIFTTHPTQSWDAGIFYCPYIPLQTTSSINNDDL